MTAKIFQFNQYKKIEFMDLYQINNEMKFDVLLQINNFPFILKNVAIQNIQKDKIRYTYDSLYHKNEPKYEKCPFCGNHFDDSICEPLTKEREEIFLTTINKELFFPMMSFYYKDKEKSYFEKLANEEIKSFEPLFFGLSEGIFIQCIFKYNNELLLFQDIANANNTDVLPLIFFYNQEYHQLHLYIEYLQPEKLLPITAAINKSLAQPTVEIFDTTGIELTQLYIDFKENKYKN